MQAIVYERTGGPEVLALTEREVPTPGPGEVLVKVAYSGVNPTDWKSRQADGSGAPPPTGWQIPNQDGCGRIVATGNGVDPELAGTRVWLYEAAYQRPWGTAAQYTVVPARRAATLDGDAPYELGAALGVPFLTAHRCLTVGELLPDRLDAGALAGHTVLVQGGAGAVGNAAVQLARWADANAVIATVSGPEKAQLAAAAGATHVIDYRRQDVVAEVRKVVPDGVDVIVEVAPAQNSNVDAQVLGPNGTVALYAGVADDAVTVPVRQMMMINARWQFVLLYTVPSIAKAVAVNDVVAAVAAGAVRVGAQAGLPLHVYPLAEAAAAHQAVQEGAIGKVLISVDPDA
jgi:NADPH:quinone reductase